MVNDRLKILSDHYKNIDNSKFEEFAEVSKQCSKEDLVVDVKNFNLFLQKNSLTSDDLSLDNFIDNLNQISDYEFVVDQFKEIYKSKKLSDFNNYLQNLKLINEHGEAGIKLFYEYGNVNEETISFLRKKVDEYRKLTDGIFGGFLKGNQIIKIENEIEKNLKSKKKIDLKKNDPNLLFFCNYADEFFSFCEKKKVNYKVLLQIIKKNNPSSISDQIKFIDKYSRTFEIIFENQDQLKKLEIKENDIDSLFENKLALLEDET